MSSIPIPQPNVEKLSEPPDAQSHDLDMKRNRLPNKIENAAVFGLRSPVIQKPFEPKRSTRISERFFGTPNVARRRRMCYCEYGFRHVLQKETRAVIQAPFHQTLF